MIRISSVSLPLDYTDGDLRAAAAKKLKLNPNDLLSCAVAKRSVDARRGQVSFLFSLDVTVKGDEKALVKRLKNDKVTLFTPLVYAQPKTTAKPAHPPVVVGSGPAGLFAALILSRAGLNPILLERGKDVDTRTADVARFEQTGVLDPASNVQFGEGGAGTFSDGKLNTGIKDERIRFVLETLAKAGDAEDLLWQARPHVGTDRLKTTVKALRQELLENGSTVRFSTCVTDIETKNGALSALVLDTPNGREILPCEQAIFAIGHSARDTVEMLLNRGVTMLQKPFAVGVRVEHKREWIDRAQYGDFAGHPALSAADYRLAVRPENGRGVYTFCMCPGGTVVAAASEEGGVAVNGMSRFARDAENSNSAVLVGVAPEDFGSNHPLAGVELQRKMEKEAFALGGGDYKAPAQTVGDFLADRASTGFGEVAPSYPRGVTPCDLRGCLPPFVAQSLKAGLPLMGKRLRGFDHAEAVLTGVETRSSSPVKMVRDEGGQSPIRGLFPCGEGAGFAGGITSSAVDGIRCAEWVIAAISAT